MNNSKQQITIFDMPRRVRHGFISLLESRTKIALDGGLITSEVGKYEVLNLPQWDTPIAVFPLRLPRKNKFPDHVFGKMHLGDAYSAFLPRSFNMPAVGATTLLQPQVTPQQFALIDMYQTVRADAFWILHAPMCFGAAVTLKIYPPEIDTTTSTKGLIWRPADHPTIAVALHHSNDLAQILVKDPRSGQSGLALKVELLDDNTTTNVETPLEMIALQAVTNVWCTGLKPEVPFRNLPALDFIPVSPPELNEMRNCSEKDVLNPIEVSGDNPTDNIQTTDTPQVKQNIPLEQVAKHEQPPNRKVRQQQGTISPIWFKFQLIQTQLSDRSWKTIVINPSQISGLGESISKAYRRNVWCTGCKTIGYMTGIGIKFKVTRSPAISGVIEIQDSSNSSSRYLVNFGENVNIPLQLSNFDSFLDFQRPRHYNNEYLRTDEAIFNGRWRILGANRTAEQSDLEVELLIQAGEMTFDVPIKPRSTARINQPLYNKLKDLIFIDINEMQNCSQLGEITALPAEDLYLGNVEDQTFESEHLVQDDFATEIYRTTIPVGVPVAFSLNLSVLDDNSGAGGQSVMSEKFERHAHIIPSHEGSYGPEVGELTIVSRLPTTITGHLEFVSVPGDMNEDVAVRAFGLASILSLAGAGVKALGGPNIANFLNAGMNVIKPITDIIGGQSKTQQQLESISTNIPISRFVQFLKPILQNEEEDPTFGSLLMQAMDVVDFKGDPVSEIPIRIFSKLLNPAVERNLINRTVTPALTMKPEIIIPRGRLNFILQCFLENKNTFIPKSYQNLCFIKFLVAIQTTFGALKLQKTLDISLHDDLIDQYNVVFQQYFDPEIQSPIEFPKLSHYGFSD